MSFPFDGRVKTAANALDRIGHLRPPAGVLAKEKSGQIELGGQALLPDKQGPAGAVLTTYNNAEGEPVICAIAPLGVPPQRSLRATWDPSALPSRWRRVLPIDRLPEG